MLEAIGSALTSVIGWIGTTVDAFVATDGVLSDLLPLIAVGVAISAFMLGVRALKGCIWGA